MRALPRERLPNATCEAREPEFRLAVQAGNVVSAASCRLGIGSHGAHARDPPVARVRERGV